MSIDLTAVTAQFAELTTAQVAVGGLILTAAVVAFAYSWIKAMFF